MVFKLTTCSVKEGDDFQSCWNKKKVLSKPAEEGSVSKGSQCNKTSKRGTRMGRAGVVRASKYPGRRMFLVALSDTCKLETL